MYKTDNKKSLKIVCTQCIAYTYNTQVKLDYYSVLLLCGASISSLKFYVRFECTQFSYVLTQLDCAGSIVYTKKVLLYKLQPYKCYTVCSISVEVTTLTNECLPLYLVEHI